MSMEIACLLQDFAGTLGRSLTNRPNRERNRWQTEDRRSHEKTIIAQGIHCYAGKTAHQFAWQRH